MYEGWKHVRSENGVDVYRKFINEGPFGSKYACVKAIGVVQASPKSVLDILKDDSRTAEYNTLYAGNLIACSVTPRHNLENLDITTIISFHMF